MKIDSVLIKEYVQESFINNYIEIRDHRNNVIVLDKGVFSFNGHEQPKTKPSIETIFLDAFKLTRHIKLDDVEYLRKGSKWYEKGLD
ncbi:hypothetical protein [Aquimarina aggregata]|uniref:hypothetical protein n=1 Tax=Aquimarina aggregata TaxID=1642818 RepID=UPI002490B9F7|nr:hypothetical protein [Aquimarina aggregata]